MSWATESDASTYLASKPGTSAWFETGVDHDAYLLTAYYSIYYNPSYEIPTSPDSDETTRLQYAQIELAWFMFNNSDFEQRQYMINSGVKSFTFGRWSESYGKSMATNNGAATYPAQVMALLDSFITAPVFTANVPRKLESYL